MRAKTNKRLSLGSIASMVGILALLVVLDMAAPKPGLAHDVHRDAHGSNWSQVFAECPEYPITQLPSPNHPWYLVVSVDLQTHTAELEWQSPAEWDDPIAYAAYDLSYFIERQGTDGLWYMIARVPHAYADYVGYARTQFYADPDIPDDLFGDRVAYRVAAALSDGCTTSVSHSVETVVDFGPSASVPDRPSGSGSNDCARLPVPEIPSGLTIRVREDYSRNLVWYPSPTARDPAVYAANSLRYLFERRYAGGSWHRVAVVDHVYSDEPFSVVRMQAFVDTDLPDNASQRLVGYRLAAVLINRCWETQSPYLQADLDVLLPPASIPTTAYDLSLSRLYPADLQQQDTKEIIIDLANEPTTIVARATADSLGGAARVFVRMRYSDSTMHRVDSVFGQSGVFFTTTGLSSSSINSIEEGTLVVHGKDQGVAYFLIEVTCVAPNDGLIRGTIDVEIRDENWDEVASAIIRCQPQPQPHLKDVRVRSAAGVIAVEWTPKLDAANQVVIVVNTLDDTDFCLAVKEPTASNHTCTGRALGQVYAVLVIALDGQGGSTLSNVVLHTAT